MFSKISRLTLSGSVLIGISATAALRRACVPAKWLKGFVASYCGPGMRPLPWPLAAPFPVVWFLQVLWFLQHSASHCVSPKRRVQAWSVDPNRTGAVPGPFKCESRHCIGIALQ